MRWYEYCLVLMAATLLSLCATCFIEHTEFRGVHPPYTHAINEVTRLRLNIISARDAYPQSFSSSAVNGWLARSNLGSNPFATAIGLESDLDPWGRPYVFLERSSPSKEIWDGMHIYSLGEDGRTDSQGDDPDDINTWYDRSFDFYVHRENRNTFNRHLKRLTWLFPLACVALLASMRMLRRKAAPGTEPRIAADP